MSITVLGTLHVLSHLSSEQACEVKKNETQWPVWTHMQGFNELHPVPSVRPSLGANGVSPGHKAGAAI